MEHSHNREIVFFAVLSTVLDAGSPKLPKNDTLDPGTMSLLHSVMIKEDERLEEDFYFREILIFR